MSFSRFHLTFKEFLAVRGIRVDKTSQFSSSRFSIAGAFADYLNYGGFPEVILNESEEQKFRILQSYMDTMFLRDLVERYQIRNQLVLREMVKHMVTSTATQFSVSAFYRWIKTVYPVTKRTLLRYLGYLEDCRLFLMVRRLSRSLKEQVLSPRKVYLVDVGLKEVFGVGQSRDTGRRLENVVAIELMRRRARNPGLDLFFWKDSRKREVDFIITERGQVIELIQVCIDMSDYRAKERELRALASSSDELGCNNLMIITLEQEGEEKAGRKMVSVVPAWKWLMEE